MFTRASPKERCRCPAARISTPNRSQRVRLGYSEVKETRSQSAEHHAPPAGPAPQLVIPVFETDSSRSKFAPHSHSIVSGTYKRLTIQDFRSGCVTERGDDGLAILLRVTKQSPRKSGSMALWSVPKGPLLAHKLTEGRPHRARPARRR
jgi:hypothetical protein